MLLVIEGLRENFKFLVIEVSSQLDATRKFLESPSHKLYDKIVSRDDYIDNLKNIIENKCFSRIHRDKELSKREVDQIRASQIICVNLERIADFCVNIVRQMGYLRDPAFLGRFDLKAMFDLVQRSIDAVMPARDSDDIAKALFICRAEHDLDTLYKANFDQVMAQLRTGLGVEDLITSLFIIRYLERIGDSLLNIGEALIFAIIGEKIKIEQFDALRQTLAKSGIDTPLTEIDLKSIWGGRSGCRISRVAKKASDPGPAHGGIFKEGNIGKIRRERENIETWSRIYPGLGPKIFSYHEDGDNASMLVEFLPGCTMEEIVLTSREDLLENAVFLLEQTLEEIWGATKLPGPAPIDYMGQLRSRLKSVLQVHPHFIRDSGGVGQSRVLSTDEIIASCAEFEKKLFAPHTVFIHGDFNLNNIVYNHSRQCVHFIDLYRSGRADAVQDVSVFLVSNFRVPVFERHLRDRLNWMIERFYAFAKAHADKNNDETFEARLGLALGRSFQTSARFEMNEAFARDMFMRGEYLLEKILRHADAPPEEFRLPEDVLYA